MLKFASWIEGGSGIIAATWILEGEDKVEVEYRDEMFVLDAPFTDEKKSILKTKMRFAGVIWGNDNVAIAGRVPTAILMLSKLETATDKIAKSELELRII